MKAICRINNLRKLPNDTVRARLSESIHVDGEIPGLEIGSAYSVLALSLRCDSGLWLYLDTFPGHHFPSPYPAELFDLTDSSIPAGWVVTLESTGHGTVIRRISFPEWARDENFYERLVAGDVETTGIYRKRRSEISE